MAPVQLLAAPLASALELRRGRSQQLQVELPGPVVALWLLAPRRVAAGLMPLLLAVAVEAVEAEARVGHPRTKWCTYDATSQPRL